MKPPRRHWARLHLGLAVALAVLTAQASAQQAPTDFGGTWTYDASSGEFVLLRDVPRVFNGWGGQVRRAREAAGYTIVIGQTIEAVSIVFPGGAANFLSRPPFLLNGESHTTVQNRGDWWTKFTTQASWNNQRLTLRARSLNGWWRDSAPAEVTTQEAQTDTVFELALDPGGTKLTMTTTLSDEKGEAQYRQVFSRADTDGSRPVRR